MGDIVFSKKIRVTSKGRFPHKKGVIMGPERFFHREEVEVIKDLLTNFPRIDIEEKTDLDKNIVKLNLNNYNKKNERRPIGMEENVTPVPDEEPKVPAETIEEEQPPVEVPDPEPVNEDPVKVDDTPVGNDDLADNAENEPVEEEQPPVEVPDPEPVNEEAAVESVEENKAEEVPAAPAQQPATTGQQSSNKKNKNKNKNKNVEVQPKEP